MPTAPLLLVLVASIAFRLPMLINAAGANSDAAVVGLQAMHLLRGEWSPYLWGSGYQTSVDSAVAALFFLVAGPSPLVLTLSTLLGHVLLTALVFGALRRSFSPWMSAALVLPLVFTPEAVHTYVLSPPRQASLTLAGAGWVLLQRTGRGRSLSFPFVGAAVSALAVYADPYALLFLPSAALLGALALVEPGGRVVRPFAARGLVALVAGGLTGIVPYLVLRRHPRATLGQTSLTLGVVDHNARLLWDDCWASLLSTRPLSVFDSTSPALRLVSGAARPVQLIGAALLVAGIISGFVLVLVRRIPWEVRRLGAAGALMLPVTLGGFLVSPMVMDHYSSRYLAAILLAAPFAVAPAAYLLGLPRFAGLLAPYLVSAGVSGWLAFLPFGLGHQPVLDADAALASALRERGIPIAVADYWASYRLTFLYRESPILVPTNEGEDRYPPYRQQLEDAPVIAYVFDRLRSRERPEDVEVWARKRGWVATGDRFGAGIYDVVVLRR